MSKKKTAVQKAKIAIIVNAIIPVVIFIALQIWNYVNYKNGSYCQPSRSILPQAWDGRCQELSTFKLILHDSVVICAWLLVILQIPSWAAYIIFKKKASKK